jgi:hypothetical protein
VPCRAGDGPKQCRATGRLVGPYCMDNYSRHCKTRVRATVIESGKRQRDQLSSPGSGSHARGRESGRSAARPPLVSQMRQAGAPLLSDAALHCSITRQSIGWTSGQIDRHGRGRGKNGCMPVADRAECSS